MSELPVFDIDADQIYIIISGDKGTISKVVQSLNKNTKKVEYIAAKVSYPLGFLVDDINRQRHEKIFTDDGVEAAQCLICGDGYCKDEYMIALIDSKVKLLSLPRVDLDIENDADNLVQMWIRGNLDSSIARRFERAIKAISLVGKDSKNLLYASRLIKKGNSLPSLV